MSTRRKLGILAAAGVAAAALAIPAAPQASASTGARFLAFGSQFGISGVTHEHFVTECGNIFSGPVTSGGATGAMVANIDEVSIDGCNQGVNVTANALPWTVEGTNVVDNGSFSIQRVDLNIATGLGTCRYTGMFQGTIDLQPNVYDIRGTLSRQSAGCGGDQQISVVAVAEAVGVG